MARKKEETIDLLKAAIGEAQRLTAAVEQELLAGLENQLKLAEDEQRALKLVIEYQRRLRAIETRGLH